jgi:hypothetical protein
LIPDLEPAKTLKVTTNNFQEPSVVILGIHRGDKSYSFEATE